VGGDKFSETLMLANKSWCSMKEEEWRKEVKLPRGALRHKELRT